VEQKPGIRRGSPIDFCCGFEINAGRDLQMETSLIKEQIGRTEADDAPRAVVQSSLLHRMIAPFILVLVSWLGTYNDSVINGDDINHIMGRSAKGYASEIFMPQIGPAWIPSRVVDNYGRSLLYQVFDMIHFPLKSLFGADVFYVFKVFNATFFTIFLYIVYQYILSRVSLRTDWCGKRPLAPAAHVFLNIFLAFSVLTIFPWFNEVQVFAYQLPIFLSFVVFTELFRRIPFSVENEEKSLGDAGLCLLSFVVAYSDEALVAIMFCSISFVWLLIWRSLKTPVWRASGFGLSVTFLIFCACSLAETIIYSQRARISSKFSSFHEMVHFYFSNSVLLSFFRAMFSMIILGIVGFTLLFLFWSRVFPAARNSFKSLTDGGSLPLIISARWFLGLLTVTFSTLLVVGVLSIDSGYNYFSITLYPWGSLWMIPVLFAVPSVAIPLAWCWNEVVQIEVIKIFVMAIFVSFLAIHTTANSFQNYEYSEAVHGAFIAAEKGTEQVYDTGLSLDEIPMQNRPLPTAASPEWFINNYHDFFKKYYNSNTTILFK